MAEKKSLNTQDTAHQTSLNLYHIYHTGYQDASFSIHSVTDSKTNLKLRTVPTISRANTVKSQTLSQRSFSIRWQSTLKDIGERVERRKALDNPEFDPRTESAPYYLHLPTLYGHRPPYTLRHGGTKRSPTTCLIDEHDSWRHWKLMLGDALWQEGVIDGRGVVGMEYGTRRGENGTLRGYPVRSRRFLGESGKEWFKARKEAKQMPVEPTKKAMSEEVVYLKWTAPCSMDPRQHDFIWRGFKFVWKGTKTVRRKKILWPFLYFSHLKLVVIGPENDPNQQLGEENKLVLARYTSVSAKRKAGRLEVYQDELESFISNKILASITVQPSPICSGKSLSTEVESDREEVFTKACQRLTDVVVATAMCMIMSEWKKRQIIIQIVLAILGSFPS